MIEELANLLDDFPGPANQTRCFTHVLNLVVKSIIQQFDLPGKPTDGSVLNKAAEELLNLAGDIEFEEAELEMRHTKEGEEDDGEDEEDDNMEGWVDEHALMTEEEVDELDESVAPVRLLLTKVT
jgi:hypothetical protein